MKRLAIIVSGKVQGVFFRATAKDQAVTLGIDGFVRNEPDGNVYIEAQGEEIQLKQFITWCRIGPPRSRVENLKIEEKEITAFHGFEVRR